MNTVAVGFWGAFFGSVALMLAGSLMAYARSLHRVALRAAVTAALSALFVVAYLGWLPIGDRDIEQRLLAHIAAGVSAVLGVMLLSLMGLGRHAGGGQRLRVPIMVLAAVVVVVGWFLSPAQSLAL